MNDKYVIVFEKSGYIRYISHLDMLRLFKRIFRRTGIRIAYSQGYHPHPKLSFALPLSLGYTGLAELLEIETEIPYETSDIVTRLNGALPQGVHVTDCYTYNGPKTVAARIESGDYRIEVPIPEGSESGFSADALKGAVERFMEQPEIKAEKIQKKSGKMTEIDIKPLIKAFSSDIIDDKLILSTTVAQGSKETLSPELVLKAFTAFVSLPYEASEVEFTRLGMTYA